MLFDDLESTVDFYHIDNGIKVKGVWYPCLKMIWVDGATLDQYVEKNFKDNKIMAELLKEFHKLVGELEGAGIGHGDLQHGNILVSTEGLRLVDYDALFVPALAGRKSLEFGHPNYQHPERSEDQYDPDVDNFSCWLIHASLLAIAIDPSLYKTLGGGDECLLFKRKDLTNPENSLAFKTLIEHESEHISETAKLLMRMLWAPPDKIPYLGAPAEHLERLPRRRQQRTAVSIDIQMPSTETASEGSKNGYTKSDTISNKAELDTIAPAAYEIDTDSLLHLTDFTTNVDKTVQPGAKRKLKRKSRFTKMSETTFKAGLKARAKIWAVADNVEYSTMPLYWLNRKLKVALAHFYNADYDKATKVFLEVFKLLDDNQESATYFNVAIWLGYCRALSGQHSLAGNSFFTALSAAKKADAPRQIRKAVLLLAVSKYSDGNETAAFRLIDENKNFLTDLSSVIEDELPNIYLSRTSAYNCLNAYPVKLKGKGGKNLRIELLSGAEMIFLNLLESQSTSCDTKLIDSYLSSIILMHDPKSDGSKTQARFFKLAAGLDKMQLTELSHIAYFCGVVAMNLYQSDKIIGVQLFQLTQLGAISPKEMLKLATAASAYLNKADIYKLLLNVAQRFHSLGLESEYSESLKVVLEYCYDNRLVLTSTLTTNLESEDDAVISHCLKATYLSENCTWNSSNALIESALKTRSTKVLAIIASDLIAQKNTKDLSTLLREMIMSLTVSQFRQIISSGTKEDRQDRELVLEALHMVATEAASRISEKNGLSEFTLLHKLKYVLKAIGDPKSANKIAIYFVSDKHAQELINWVSLLARNNQKGPLHLFIQELVLMDQREVIAVVLQRLMHDKQTTIMETTLKYLGERGRPEILFDVAKLLAHSNDYATLLPVTNELVKIDNNDTLIDPSNLVVQLMDYLFSLKPDGDASHVSFIFTQLIQNGKNQSLAAVLSYLQKTSRLYLIAPIAKDLINSNNYENSLFPVLAARSDLETIGGIVCCVAATLETNGLALLTRMFINGKVRDTDLVNIYSAAIRWGSVMLDTRPQMIERAELNLPDTNDGAQPKGLPKHHLNKQLMSAIVGLHYTRMFVSKLRANIANSRELVQECNTSIDAKYDRLTVWCVSGLAKNQAGIETIASMAIELAELRKEDCLSKMVLRLAGQRHLKVLESIAQKLVSSNHTMVPAFIAVELARSHTLAAKHVMVHVIDYLNDANDLFTLIDEIAKINIRLTDIIIRQVARGPNAILIQDIAVRLAEANSKQALYLVLNQLVSMNDVDTSKLFETLDNCLQPAHVSLLASWLAEEGLSNIMQERIDDLTRRGNKNKAAVWQQFLVQ
mgnify:CR=1 FL=1